MAKQDELYALTAVQVARIDALLQQFEGGGSPPLQQPGRRPLLAARVLVGALDSAVTATTGLFTKPKVGTLSIYSFSSTGSADTGVNVSCYNFAPQPASTDRWTVVERDNWTGKWVITTQFCS